MPTRHPRSNSLPRLFLPLLFLLAVGSAQAEGPTTIEGVAEVVAGGTLAIDGKTVQLIGIVAPGPRQKCRDGSLPWLCGAAARKHLLTLIGEHPVRCDIKSPGVAACRANGHDLGAAMVRDGWAVAEQDAEAYLALEREARAARRGLWEKAP